MTSTFYMFSVNLHKLCRNWLNAINHVFKKQSIFAKFKMFWLMHRSSFFFMKQSIFAEFEMFWLIHRSPLIQDIAESIRASGLNFNKFFATLTFKTYTSQFFSQN